MLLGRCITVSCWGWGVRGHGRVHEGDAFGLVVSGAGRGLLEMFRDGGDGDGSGRRSRGFGGVDEGIAHVDGGVVCAGGFAGDGGVGALGGLSVGFAGGGGVDAHPGVGVFGVHVAARGLRFHGSEFCGAERSE